MAANKAVTPVLAKPVLRQDSSRSSLRSSSSSLLGGTNDEDKAGEEAAPERGEEQALHPRRAPVLRQGSSSASSSILAEQSVSSATGSHSDARPKESALGVMSKRWRALRRRRVEEDLRAFALQEHASNADTTRSPDDRIGRGGHGADDDDSNELATLLACCIIASAALLWVIGTVAAMLAGAMYFNNSTLVGMWDDFQHTRARNLNMSFEELTGRAPGSLTLPGLRSEL